MGFFFFFPGLRQKQREDIIDFSNDQEDNILEELSLFTTFYNPSDKSCAFKE